MKKVFLNLLFIGILIITIIYIFIDGDSEFLEEKFGINQKKYLIFLLMEKKPVNN